MDLPRPRPRGAADVAALEATILRQLMQDNESDGEGDGLVAGEASSPVHASN